MEGLFFFRPKVERVAVFVVLLELSYFLVLSSLNVLVYFLDVLVVQKNIVVGLNYLARRLDGLQRLSGSSICVVKAVVGIVCFKFQRICAVQHVLDLLLSLSAVRDVCVLLDRAYSAVH